MGDNKRKSFLHAIIAFVDIEKGITGREKDVLVVLDRHHEAANYITQGPVPPEFKSDFLILPIISHIEWAQRLGKIIANEEILTDEIVRKVFHSFL